MDSIKEIFADRLHKAARDVGFNRKTTATKMGVSEGTIASWWRGETSLSAIQLNLYAEITSKHIMWFYGEDTEPITNNITISKHEYDDLKNSCITEKTRADQLEKLYNQLLSKITMEE